MNRSMMGMFTSPSRRTTVVREKDILTLIKGGQWVWSSCSSTSLQDVGFHFTNNSVKSFWRWVKFFEHRVKGRPTDGFEKLKDSDKQAVSAMENELVAAGDPRRSRPNSRGACPEESENTEGWAAYLY